MVISMRYMSNEEFISRLEKIRLENEQIELRNKLKAERRKIRQFDINQISTSNKVLVASIIAIITFTIACLFIQYHTGAEVSSTLITLWFSFWTVEIVALTGIKVSKIFKNYKSAPVPVVESEIVDDADAVG